MTSQWARPEQVARIAQHSVAWIDAAVREAERAIDILRELHGAAQGLPEATVLEDEVAALDSTLDQLMSEAVELEGVANRLANLR